MLLFAFFLFSIVNCSNLTYHFPNLLAVSKCPGADEVPSTVYYNWWSGSGDKTAAHAALDSISAWLKSNPNGQSYQYTSGNINAVIWSGSMIQNTGLDANIILSFKNEIDSNGIQDLGYYEYIGTNPMQSFGIAIDTTGGNALNNLDRALKLWSEGKKFGTNTGYKAIPNLSVCFLEYANRKPITNNLNIGACDYVKVVAGQDLASQTGVNGESLQGYNPSLDFSKLQTGQPVCYSIGSLPNFAPNENSDGTCFAYKVGTGDTCASIAVKYYPLTTDNIESYNKNGYIWKGCSKIQADQNICLSPGKIPKPTPNPKAECGPYAPGGWTTPPECPNKGCCSNFGFCGLTSEFCDSDTCYSNCGYGTLPTSKSSTFKSVAYWIDSDSGLYSDPNDIDSSYNIVHYSFATINSDMSISVGSGFQDFLNIKAKKVVAFGGWDFSTNPATYDRFRKAVSDAQRPTFVQNVINFYNQYKLDGIHFDWEYPEAPDIPGIPAGIKGDGARYSQLFKDIKAKQPMMLSVAIPASFWYLKGFPLTDLDKNMDYFVLMNYDYYGQWDYGKNIGIGCHVNRENTTDSIKMVVKSGVNTKKVYGGVANYARSYKLTNPTCNTFGCGFTGPNSGAFAGSITNTPGIILKNEIPASAKMITDSTSNCDIYTYNDDNWAASMSLDNRNNLIQWYNSIGLGGNALWAVNYDNIDSGSDTDYNSTEEYEDEANYYGNYDWSTEATCSNNYDFINSDTVMDLWIVSNTDASNACIAKAYAQFIINMGYQGYNNITGLDQSKYDKAFNAFRDYSSKEILDEYADWAYYENNLGNQKYFTCDSNNCQTLIGDTLQQSLTCGGNPRNNIITPKPRISPLIGSCGKLFIKDDIISNENGAAQSLGDYLNITVTPDHFVKTDSKIISGNINLQDSTIVKAVDLILDPKVNVTSDVLNNIKTICDSVGSNLDINVYDTLSALEPVMIFIQMSENIMQIYEEGLQIEKVEEEQRKLMIINIVFTVVGLVSNIGTEAAIAAILDVALSLAQFLADYAITGKVDPGDAVALGLGGAGLFGELISGIKNGAKLSELVSNLNDLKTSDVKTSLSKFKYYKKIKATKLCN